MTSRPHRLFLVAVTLITALLKLEGVLVDYMGTHHRCFVDRYHPASPKLDHGVSSAMLIGSFVLVGLICVLAGFKQRINIIKACFMTAANLSGYVFIIFLKEFIGDTNCNGGRANSVSGHFAFYVFHLLTLPYIWRHSFWPNDDQPWNGRKDINEEPKPGMLNAIRATFAVFAILTVATLFRTYYFGYHSLSQCLNGVLFAILMHVACVYLIQQFHDPSQETVVEARRPRPSISAPPADIPLIVFGLFNIASFILCYIYHGAIPLAYWEVVLFAGVWAKILWGPL